MVTSDNRRETLQQDLNMVKEDLRKLKGDAGVFARDAFDVGRGSVVEIKGHVQDRLMAVAAKGRSGAEMVRGQIGNRPRTAVAAAFGVGLVLGLVLLGARARTADGLT